jgi:hypothetical protein
VAALLVLGSAGGAALAAQTTAEPEYLADRGPGIKTSLFGTFVEKGELLV